MKINILKTIRDFIFTRLWVQVWFGLALVVGVLLALLGSLLIRTSEEGVRTTLLRDHREIALRAAQEIKLFVESPKQLLELTAALVGVSHADLWKQETLLVELGLRFPIFNRISSVSLDGEEKVSSEPGTPNLNFSTRMVVREALEGKTSFSPISISEEGIPIMEMAVPYRNLGQVVGVLRAVVSLRGVWDIVDQIQIGQTGFAYVVSSNGTVLAHQDKKMVLKNLSLATTSHVKRALAGESGSTVLKLQERAKVLTAYAPISEWGWGLVTQQDWDEAFSFAQTMTRESRLFILLSLLFSVAICIVLAYTFSRPIRSLAKAANEVAEGNFEITLSSKRKDEIGTLMRNFSHMIEQLKKAKAMERLTAMGMAAASIAHELRNPLVAIKTYTQIFSRRKNEPSFLDRFERTIPPEINRLGSLLDELSDFAKVQQVKLSKVSLNLILDETLLLMRERFDEQKIMVNRDQVSKEGIVILGDKERLKQVFINLVTNAVEAMTSGGVLSIHAKHVDSSIEILVSDSGKGIPANELPNVFEPFHTIGKRGLGLGLAICRNIIEQHQGKIEIQSQLNHGTTFSIILPLAISGQTPLRPVQ